MNGQPHQVPCSPRPPAGEGPGVRAAGPCQCSLLSIPAAISWQISDEYTNSRNKACVLAFRIEFSSFRVFVLSRFRDKNVFVLLTPKIVKFLTKSSDQRERIEVNRAVARIGWRPCRPLCHTHASHRGMPRPACPAVLWHWCLMPLSAVSLFSEFASVHAPSTNVNPPHGTISVFTSKSRKPSRSVHSVATHIARPCGSMRVKPSSVTRIESFSNFTSGFSLVLAK